MIIDVQNREVLDYLQRLINRLEDISPVMDAIGQRLEEHISMRFETESDPAGREWAPWKPGTLNSYPKDGHRRVLDRYGTLLRSLSHQVDRTGVTVGFGQPYAAYHEYGAKFMERRGLLFDDPRAGTLGADDERAILDIVAAYLDG